MLETSAHDQQSPLQNKIVDSKLAAVQWLLQYSEDLLFRIFASALINHQLPLGWPIVHRLALLHCWLAFGWPVVRLITPLLQRPGVYSESSMVFSLSLCTWAIKCRMHIWTCCLRDKRFYSWLFVSLFTEHSMIGSQCHSFRICACPAFLLQGCVYAIRIGLSNLLQKTSFFTSVQTLAALCAVMIRLLYCLFSSSLFSRKLSFLFDDYSNSRVCARILDNHCVLQSSVPTTNFKKL